MSRQSIFWIFAFLRFFTLAEVSLASSGGCLWNCEISRCTLRCANTEWDVVESYLSIADSKDYCSVYQSLELNIGFVEISNISEGTFRLINKCPQVTTLTLRNDQIETFQAAVLKDSKVEHLDLSNNQLRSLDFLADTLPIMTLDVSNNLINSLAANINWPKSALTVNIAFNNLTQVSDKAFVKLTADSLDLSGNGLKELPNDVFSGATRLKKLSLAGNQILSATKNTWKGLAELTDLSLRDNTLSGIEGGVFAELVKLISLDLAGNSIADIKADTFAGLVALEVLDLSGMRGWNKLEAGTFKDLANLKRLSIARNRFGVIAKGSLAGLAGKDLRSTCAYGTQAYKTYDLCELGIESIETGALDDLKGACSDLLLGGNGLKSIAAGTFSELAGSVHKLEMNSTGIEILDAEAFGKLAFCGTQTLLRLDGNKIQSLKANTFGRITNLNVLNLTVNEIATIEEGAFSGLRTLSVIELSGNKLTEIKKGAFSDIRNLQKLALGHNPISKIEIGAFSGTYMTVDSSELLLNNNELTVIPKGQFKGLFFLASLDLSNNRIESIDTDAFNHLDSLRSLNLARNQLKSLDVPLYQSLLSLNTLVLSHNQLTSLESQDFSLFQELINLDLSDNSISQLSPESFNNSKIIAIDLSRNRLSELPERAFSNSPRLQILRLGENTISRINLLAFSGLTANLNFLNVSHNSLTTINSETFQLLRQLKFLYLSSNTIASIDIDAFISTNYLEILDLSRNQLAYLEIGTFVGVPNLVMLNISYNQLTTLRPGLFVVLRNSNSLTLHVNNNHLREFNGEEIFAGFVRTAYIANNNLSCEDLAKLLLKYPNQIFNQYEGQLETDKSNVRGVGCLDTASTRSASSRTLATGALALLMVTVLSAWM